MKRRAIKRIAVLMALVILACFIATGCSEADQVQARTFLRKQTTLT